jgi:multidrug efflux pump subunit AcrB
MSDTPHNDAPKNGFAAKLGLAGALAKGFITSPLSPLLLVACLGLGIMGLISTPRQEDPQISVPMVDIFFAYPGASAQQVASLATDPLERMLSEIQGVDHVYSVSERGGAMVTVQFDVGEALGPSLVKLNDKIQSNLDRIPPGVSQPLIKPKGVDDVPVVTLTLWSHTVDDAALRSLGLDVVQAVKQGDNTAQTFIVGGRSNAIRVEVFPERLAGFGIGLDELATTIRNANAARGVGSVENGQTSFTIYTGSFLQTKQDVENLMVGVAGGSPTYIRDIALVTDGTNDATDVVAYYTGPAYEDISSTPQRAPNGAAAVTIAFAKKSGSNGVSVADGILEMVDHLKGSLIPDNVNVEVTRNYGETANEKVNELIFKLFVVTGAVTLLIWLSLGVRAAIVVLIVIPIVILMTVFAAWLLGFTIDRVSLFALIFSIGILVDDAIVVVENIYRRWLEIGECSEDCSVDAVREVGNPTILATFTVIAALLPMGFVTGMMGPYMGPIPALGSVAMLFSLFAAFIFTPWLAQRIKPSIKGLEKAQKKEHRQAEWLHGFFKKLLIPLIKNRLVGTLFALGLILAFLLSMVLFNTTSVTVKMLPNDNKPEFNVTVNMPDGTALPVTASVVAQIAQELRNIPEVTALQSYAGTASPFNFNGLVRHTYLRNKSWMGDIQVQLQDKADRTRDSHSLAVAAREMIQPLAERLGARIEVIEMPPGPPVLQTMVAEIYGPDAETRREVARAVEGMFNQAETITDADSYLQMPYEAQRFVINREKASRRGVSVETINRQLEMAMGGFILGDSKMDRALEPRFIILQMPLGLRNQFGRIGQLPIPTATGAMIPLSELGHFEPFPMDDPIYHKDLRAVEYVTGEVTGRLGAPIYGILEMEDLLDAYTAPDNVRINSTLTGPPADSLSSALEWTGEWTVTYITFRDMGIAFGVALVLIYILVVWEFGNFTMPAIVMAPIPLTLIGIVPGHWLLGAPFTATSMIGFIALAGIIVRNSILLVDFSRSAVERGMPVVDAVISGCATRSRPIIITALALVVGSSVILTDPIFQGMAISLMFGGAVSTILTLVVIPLGCVSFRKALCETCDMHEDAAVSSPITDRHKSGSFWRGLLALGDFLWLIVLTIGLLVATFFKTIVNWGRGLFGGHNDGGTTPPPSKPTPVKPTPAAQPAATPPPTTTPPAAKPSAPPAAKPPAPKAKAAKAKAARAPAPKAKAKAKPKAAASPAAKAKTKPKAAASPAAKAKAAPKPKTASKKPRAAAGRRGIRIKPSEGDS